MAEMLRAVNLKQFFSESNFDYTNLSLYHINVHLSNVNNAGQVGYENKQKQENHVLLLWGV